MAKSRFDKYLPAFLKAPKEKNIVKRNPRAAELGRTGISRTLFSVTYNGEKNLGEAGPIKNYLMDYVGLSLRSWQALIESEVAQTILGRYGTWVISRGLKLQAEPLIDVLASEGINLTNEDRIAFAKLTEARFNCWKKSRNCDFGRMMNLNKIAKVAHKNATVGGDVLVVLRYENENINVQLIDGYHVQSPVFGTESWPQELADGHRIINGIEVDVNGEHIRYFVKDRYGKVTPYDAKGAGSGLTKAFLIYGMEYRLNNVRGLPLISAVIETLKKLERYKEATLGSAEERQKIAYTIEHGVNSTGENILEKQAMKAFAIDVNEDIPEDINGNAMADRIAASTDKQVFNMPLDSRLVPHESKAELLFKEFYQVNIDLICAALGIPPEVAMSKYDSNYSASRAALKDWEHTLNVKREEFSDAFYQPIYNFWLEIEILKLKIKAPGYINARIANNDMIIAAYQNARFVGATVPHIDPLKEVKAERAKLGILSDDIPLGTVEQATENLNGGNSDENMIQYASEIETAKKLGIIVPPPVVDPTKPVPATATASEKKIISMLSEIADRMEELEKVH